jgi:hypothetical protein
LCRRGRSTQIRTRTIQMLPRNSRYTCFSFAISQYAVTISQKMLLRAIQPAPLLRILDSFRLGAYCLISKCTEFRQCQVPAACFEWVRLGAALCCWMTVHFKDTIVLLPG